MLKFSIFILLFTQTQDTIKIEQDTIKKIVEDTKFEMLQSQIKDLERKIGALDAFTGRRLDALEKDYSTKQKIIEEESIKEIEEIKKKLVKLENENLAQVTQFNQTISTQRKTFYSVIIISIVLIFLVIKTIFPVKRKEKIDLSFELINVMGKIQNSIAALAERKKTEIESPPIREEIPFMHRVIFESLETSNKLINVVEKIQSNIALIAEKTKEEIQPSPTVREVPDMYKSIYELKDNGLSEEEIAKKLKMGKGEVELVLNLRKLQERIKK